MATSTRQQEDKSPLLARDCSNKQTRFQLDLKEEFFMVLVRMRLDLYEDDLAYRFGVTQSYVSTLLNSWLPFLSAQLQTLISWPTTTIGPTTDAFCHLPNTVAIIDCTEIFIERPSRLETQKMAYSEYKSHCTIKYLGAVDTFTGAFIYMCVPRIQWQFLRQACCREQWNPQLYSNRAANSC
jgi:hypothetical protein